MRKGKIRLLKNSQNTHLGVHCVRCMPLRLLNNFFIYTVASANPSDCLNPGWLKHVQCSLHLHNYRPILSLSYVSQIYFYRILKLKVLMTWRFRFFLSLLYQPPHIFKTHFSTLTRLNWVLQRGHSRYICRNYKPSRSQIQWLHFRLKIHQRETFFVDGWSRVKFCHSKSSVTRPAHSPSSSWAELAQTVGRQRTLDDSTKAKWATKMRFALHWYKVYEIKVSFT